jgi:hypothetical protein
MLVILVHSRAGFFESRQRTDTPRLEQSYSLGGTADTVEAIQNPDGGDLDNEPREWVQKITLSAQRR